MVYMVKIIFEIPKPTISIRIKKIDDKHGEITIGEMTTPGELIANIKRPMGGKRK